MDIFKTIHGPIMSLLVLLRLMIINLGIPVLINVPVHTLIEVSRLQIPFAVKICVFHRLLYLILALYSFQFRWRGLELEILIIVVLFDVDIDRVALIFNIELNHFNFLRLVFLRRFGFLWTYIPFIWRWTAFGHSRIRRSHHCEPRGCVWWIEIWFIC